MIFDFIWNILAFMMEENNYNLFLDDFRIPLDAFAYTKNPIYLKETWVIVRNYQQFINTIDKQGLPNIISFDHDLADVHYEICDSGLPINYDDMVDDNEKTGFHCAKWLVNYCMDNGYIEIPKYYVHSQNTVGSDNIRSLLENYTKHRND